MGLKLYGYMISQPTRAAAWLLRVKQVPFEFVETVPRTKATATPEFLRMNPNGQVPVLTDGAFTLFEGNAILQYLAEKHQWTDVYPLDVAERAKIHQYLHWHHSNTRQTTVQVIRPMVMRARGVATPEQLEQLTQTDETLARILLRLETFFEGDAPYVAGTAQPSIADFACYCELDQLVELGLFEFDRVPRIHAWLKRMKELPHHDVVRQDLYALCETLRGVQSR